MSKTNEPDGDTRCCASCGIAGVDDVKLMRCTACYLVRYCSVMCQKNHRPQHKRACKKRAAELRDELLFRQPEGSHLGDCPICMLPLLLGSNIMTDCCSKVICRGCHLANEVALRERGKSLPQQLFCPFCREAAPGTEEGCEKQRMKRVEMNDPVAIRYMGTRCYHEGDYDNAFDYFTKACELGDADAHYQLSTMYRDGFVEQDKKKELYHLEEATILGHPGARCNLAVMDGENGRLEREVKHYIIAASLGHDLSLKNLKIRYLEGSVKKEDLATAIRAYQAAVDEMSSPQRDAAAALLLSQNTI